jgi:UDP-N-acetylglucosamine 2-epimerase
MTGQMLERIEPVMEREAPDWVVVFGDANSTLAGALAAAKLGLPLTHVEAGLRSFDRSMPEELNRVVVDHCADLLFAPTEVAMSHLVREGLESNARLTGDIMYDSLLHCIPIAEERSRVIEQLGLEAGAYMLATVHRAANTDDQEALGRVIDALSLLDETVIFPMHPRTRLALASGDLEVPPHVRVIEPVGYLDMLALERAARAVLTDSGGVQKEAYLLAVPCTTLREDTEWPETLSNGWNILTGTDPQGVVQALRRPRPQADPPPAFGDGNAGARMVDLLQDDSSHRRCLS